MDNAGYTTLTRQSGLLREMQVVANNIANISTTGFRREGLVFSEHVKAVGHGHESLSMATATVGSTELVQGAITQTGGKYDFAIEGRGFFMVVTPDGDRLTRAGSFTPSAQGEIQTADGHRLLDSGGAPIQVPPTATDIRVASDGTISASGQPIAQVGIFEPVSPTDLSRQQGTMFSVENGVQPVDGSNVVQGFLEDSNVSAVREIARMIEVQHAYELGQKLMENEDERIRNVLQTLGK